ncbi:hypothetical protein CerSpe_154730 [Prunus speciosa]
MFTAVMDMIVYQSLVASFAILVGLLVSGGCGRVYRKRWGSFNQGFLHHEPHIVGYIVWQLFAICGVGLIFEASSLFSNVVSTLGLPVVPVLAVIFFHGKLDRIKVVAMVLIFISTTWTIACPRLLRMRMPYAYAEALTSWRFYTLWFSG